MSKYIRSLLKEFQFDGDTVRVWLRPILFEDSLRFNSLPIIEGRDGRPTIDSIEVAKLSREITPKYIEKMEGLTDAAGAPISVEEVFSSSYFASLVSEIAGELVQAGTPPNPLKSAER